MDFDVHQHLDFGTDIDKYAAGMRKLKIRAAVSSIGPPFTHPGNHAVEDAFRRHPDVVIGFGYVALGRGDTPKTVADLHRRGFRGLKCIIPTKDYDDKSFYPIYRKAEELKMPILFHTGVMARTEEFAASYPDVPELQGIDHRSYDVSSRRMNPETLDAVARAFPDLKIIMAHFGSFGRRDNAAAVIQWNPNVYGDLTEWGWYEYPKYTKKAVRILGDITDRRVRERLVWGTDHATSHDTHWLPIFRESIRHIARGLGIRKPLLQRIMGGTMEEILGLETRP
jgi:hypothetical protein